MKRTTKTLIIAVGLFAFGCEDVIDVNLDTAAPRLVIDASIDWIKNTPGNEQRIVLSTTTGYYNEAFPTVSGATIRVTNTSNATFDFIETPNTGEYSCTDFEPIIGETYTLTIVLNEETYTATETLMGITDIEDTIDQDDTGGFAGDEIEITYYYQDDGAQENYFLHRIITPQVAFPQFKAENDENSQGNLIPEFYSHEDLSPGDSINIQLYGISKRYYDYIRKVLLASGNDSGPFPTIPTAVRGNIINQTHSENYALGYFRLSEVDTRDYMVQ